MESVARKRIIDEIVNILNLADDKTLLSIRDNAIIEFNGNNEESIKNNVEEKHKGYLLFKATLEKNKSSLPGDFNYKEEYADYLVKKYESID